MNDYADPVARLLTLGEPSADEWADYRELGLGPEHAAELTRLATDRELHPEEPNSPADHGPRHAWREGAEHTTNKAGNDSIHAG